VGRRATRPNQDGVYLIFRLRAAQKQFKLISCALRYSAQTIVDFQLTFPAGYSLPSCAPDFLISLSCGQAGLHPNMEGYSYSQSSSPDISANGTYPLTLYVSAYSSQNAHAVSSFCVQKRQLLSTCPPSIKAGYRFV